MKGLENFGRKCTGTLERYRKIHRQSHRLVANSLLYSRIPTEVHNNVNFSIKASQCKLVCKGISK